MSELFRITLVPWAGTAWAAAAAGVAGCPGPGTAWMALAGTALCAAGALLGRGRPGAWLTAGLAFAFLGLGALAAPPGGAAVPSAGRTALRGVVLGARPMPGGRVVTLRTGEGGPPVEVRIPFTGHEWLDRGPRLRPGERARLWVRPTEASGPRATALCPAAVRRCGRADAWERWRALPARARQVFQHRARARLVQHSADDAGALLMALVTGRREWIRNDVRQALRWSGLAHLAVVSGLHVGLVVVGLSAACAVPLGRWHRTGQLLALGASAAALALLPATPPVRRAALALLITRAGLLSGRGARSGHALAGAALVLLALWPELSVSWSFALTVSATASLLLAARWRGWLAGVVAALAPFLATWPLLVCMTGRMSPWGPVANGLAAPAVPVALGGAWLRVLIPEGIAGLGELAEHVARLAATWILAVAHESSAWPGSGALAGPTGPAWAALMLGALACALVLRRGPALAGAWLAMGALWLWPIASADMRPGREAPELCVLDVGQGQAILLRDAKRAFLVDTGSRFRARDLADGLSAARARRLDGVLLTHLDEDHAGGLLPVLAGTRPAWVAAPASVRDSPQARRLASIAAHRGISWRWLAAGDRISRGDVEITIVWPEPGLILHGNEGGLVMRARAGRLGAVVLGDAPIAVETRVDRSGRFREAAVLVASHHGARGGTGARTLRAVAPLWVPISCGPDNRFGHPHANVVERVDAAGAARWITSRSGGACFRAAGAGPAHAVRPLEVPSRSPLGVGGNRSPG